MRYPTLETALREVAYDPETGAFTRLDTGEDATCSGGGLYRGISAGDGYCLAHRLAWRITYGAYPSRFIDHINGDPSDNRIANLRLCTQSQNCQNKRVSSRSKSGIKGVSFDPKRAKWAAFICIKGRQTILGRFPSSQEAAEAYRRAALTHFGEFARP